MHFQYEQRYAGDKTRTHVRPSVVLVLQPGVYQPVARAAQFTPIGILG